MEMEEGYGGRGAAGSKLTIITGRFKAVRNCSVSWSSAPSGRQRELENELGVIHNNKLIYLIQVVLL
jgi:hypothetical protein